MQIKIISVAIALFVIFVAGCASNGGEWSKDKSMTDNPTASDQPQTTMESSMDRKESKPMWDEGSKY